MNNNIDYSQLNKDEMFLGVNMSKDISEIDWDNYYPSQLDDNFIAAV